MGFIVCETTLNVRLNVSLGAVAEFEQGLFGGTVFLYLRTPNRGLREVRQGALQGAGAGSEGHG